MMKKLLFLGVTLIFGANISSFAQDAEIAPISGNTQATPSTNALFDPLFNYDIGANIGVNGNAGVAFVDDYFWVSAWASDEIRVINDAGNFIDTFTVPGVTGIRSFTYDGTYVYAGTASNKIYAIDPATKLLEEVITIYSTAGSAARMLAYDPNLAGGDGGFWTGNFSTAIEAFDMDGNSIEVIPFANHGHAIYGGAVDLVSPGGPFLWIHSQGTVSGESQVVQIKIADGTLTGVMYDYNTSGQQPSGNTSIAGGLFISDEVVPGKTTIIGVGQGTPSDQMFGVELASSAGVNNNIAANFNIYPNPVSGNEITIQTGVLGEKLVEIYDVLGKRVLNTVLADTQLNVSALKAGVYMVSVTQNKATLTKKLVVQ